MEDTKNAGVNNVSVNWVPFYRRLWFYVLIFFIIPPVVILIGITGQVYKKQSGTGLRVPILFGNRIGLVVLAIGLTYKIIVEWNNPSPWDRYIDSVTAVTLPKCDDDDGKGVVKTAIEQNALSPQINIKVLDFKNLSEISYDASTPIRQCKGVAVLNTGDQAITYSLAFNSDKTGVLAKVFFADQ